LFFIAGIVRSTAFSLPIYKDAESPPSSPTMSSRAMKKLLRDSNGPTPMRDIELNATKNAEGEDRHENQEEDEEEEDDYIPKRPPARNLFALVIQLSFCRMYTV